MYVDGMVSLLDPNKASQPMWHGTTVSILNALNVRHTWPSPRTPIRTTLALALVLVLTLTRTRTRTRILGPLHH